MPRSLVCLSLLFAVLLFGSPASAQSTVTISGVVQDASGGVLPGAVVDAVVAARTVATTTAGSSGRYEIEIPAGAPVSLRVSLEGFADHVVALPGVVGPITRDMTLQVGRVSDTLVVTASRGVESLTTVTHSVTVATRADIDALGSRSLADVVRFAPGVAVEGNGREGSPTSMFSRGGESDYNLVLIDGVRVNANGGAFDFSRIGTAEIERVEVVRGAQSSLWGSDAMGAVVQVFTRRSGALDRPLVTGSLEGGSFNSWRSDVRLSGGHRQVVDYQIGASDRRTDGAFADLLPQDDEFEQTTFDVAVGGTLGRRASLRSGLRYNRGLGHPPGPITFGSRDTGTRYETTDVTWNLDVSHAIGARFTGTGTINYARLDSESADTVGDAPFSTFAILEGSPNARFPNGMRLVRFLTAAEFTSLSAAGAMPAPGQFLASSTSFDFASATPSMSQLRRPAIRYQGDVPWAAGRLSAGYEWERERRPERTTAPLVTELANDNSAFFVQQQISVNDRWFVTAGVRADAKDGYDTFVSPKLSAGGLVVPARRGPVSSVKVFGNVGKGIKSPLFIERFGAGFADPNPALKVERARTSDVGVEATFAEQRIRGAVTYFNNDYTDQIAFRFGPVGDGVPEYLNIDGSEADGWEIEAALQRPVAGFTAAASYSLVDTGVVTNLSTSQQFQPGQPLLRRPKHSGTFRAAYADDRVTASVDVRMVGDRHDNSFLFMRTVANSARPAFSTDITVNPGYTVAGFGVDVRASERVTLYLRGNNVGDTAYDSALGYPGMPRAFVVGARVTVSAR